MNSTNKQSGMTIVEVVLIAVIVGMVGFVGYWVYDANKTSERQFKQSATDTSNKSTESSDLQNASEIKSTADLNAAESELDQVNPDDSAPDETQLDGQMGAF